MALCLYSRVSLQPFPCQLAVQDAWGLVFSVKKTMDLSQHSRDVLEKTLVKAMKEYNNMKAERDDWRQKAEQAKEESRPIGPIGASVPKTNADAEGLAAELKKVKAELEQVKEKLNREMRAHSLNARRVTGPGGNAAQAKDEVLKEVEHLRQVVKQQVATIEMVEKQRSLEKVSKEKLQEKIKMLEEEGGITQMKAELEQQQEKVRKLDRQMTEKEKVLVDCTAYTQIVSAHAKRLEEGMCVLLKPGGAPERFAGQRVKILDWEFITVARSQSHRDTTMIYDKIVFLDEAGNQRSWPVVFVEPVEEEMCEQLSKKARVE